MHQFNTLSMLALQAGGGNRGLMILVIYVISFGAIAYFLLIRPQQRVHAQHQAMIGGLKRGDEVVMEGGVIGTIVHLADDRLTLKSGETRLVVARGRVARVIEPPTNA